MTWFYSHEGRQIGPVTEETFQRLCQQGVIGPQTLVWYEGLTQWVEFKNLATASTLTQPVPQQVPSPSNKTATSPLPPVVTSTTTSDTIIPADYRQCLLCARYYPPVEIMPVETGHICAGCKPWYRQMVLEGLPLPAAPGSLHFAPLGKRVGAFILDGIIIYVLQMLVLMPASMLLGNLVNQAGPENFAFFIAFQIAVNLCSLLIQMSYHVLFWRRFEATPGKMVFRLKVVRGDGSRLSWGRCFGRHFAMWLSSLTCCIGYLTPWFDEERRALHDFVCDTRVIEASK